VDRKKGTVGKEKGKKKKKEGTPFFFLSQLDHEGKGVVTGGGERKGEGGRLPAYYP